MALDIIFYSSNNCNQDTRSFLCSRNILSHYSRSPADSTLVLAISCLLSDNRGFVQGSGLESHCLACCAVGLRVSTPPAIIQSLDAAWSMPASHGRLVLRGSNNSALQQHQLGGEVESIPACGGRSRQDLCLQNSVPLCFRYRCL